MFTSPPTHFSAHPPNHPPTHLAPPHLLHLRFRRVVALTTGSLLNLRFPRDLRRLLVHLVNNLRRTRSLRWQFYSCLARWSSSSTHFVNDDSPPHRYQITHTANVANEHSKANQKVYITSDRITLRWTPTLTGSVTKAIEYQTENTK